MNSKSEVEAMHELAKQLWERYFKPRAAEELMGHSLDGYKASVVSNNGDGTLTVQRPFDTQAMTLRCPPGLAEEAAEGDQVLVVELGDASNAFILCKTDLSGLGGGSAVQLGTISFSAVWSGQSSPYTQVVTVDGAEVTANSKVDLQPTAIQAAGLVEDGVQSLMIANNNGVLTAYAVGAAPSGVLLVQCTVEEVR